MTLSELWAYLSTSRLETKVDFLIQKVDNLFLSLKGLNTQMHEKFEELRQRLDTATNGIAAELKALKDQISGGLSASEAQKVVDDMTPLIERLEGMGKDENNPIPE